MNKAAYSTEELANRSFAVATAVGTVDEFISILENPGTSREDKVQAVRDFHDTAFGAGTMSTLVNLLATVSKRAAEANPNISEALSRKAETIEDVLEGALSGDLAVVDVEVPGVTESDAKGG